MIQSVCSVVSVSVLMHVHTSVERGVSTEWFGGDSGCGVVKLYFCVGVHSTTAT